MTKQNLKRGATTAAAFALALCFLLSSRVTNVRVSAQSNGGVDAGHAKASFKDGDGGDYASLLATAHRKIDASLKDLPQQPSTPPSSQGEPTVDQTRKNIQVLKGLPESQLFIVMNNVRASLGVSCAYCHVNSGGDNWEWEKDDKEEKKVARKMMQMTIDINKNYFNGRPAVSCYTCHLGAEHPASIPPLPQTPPEGGAAGEQRPATPRAAAPTADQILDKYVQAIGGRAAYERLKTRVERGTQTTWDGRSIPLEVYHAAPNKFVSILTTPRMGVISTGYNGTVGWTKNQRGGREITGAQLEQLKRAGDFYGDLHLKEQYPNLTARGRDKIGDREQYILTARVGDHRVERFYFDAQTGLLTRILVLNDSPVGRIPEQTDFEDYREVDGVKLPFTIRQSYVDPWIGWTRKLSEIKHNVAVDEKQFNMPPAAAPAAKP